MRKPQSIEEYRTTVNVLITETMEAMGATFTPEQVQQLTDEIIFVGCPHIFMTDAGELPFTDEVLAAGDCLR